MDIYLSSRQMTSREWVGNRQTFGDIVKLSLDETMNYYHLNSDQRSTVRWLAENHIPMLAERYVFDVAKVRSVLSFSRVGFDKDTQFIVLSLVLIEFERLESRVLDNRLILVGSNGGKNLLNPHRRGNDVHGKYVLIKPALHSCLEPRTFA